MCKEIQVGINVLLPIKLVFGQKDRQLGLGSGEGGQRFVVQGIFGLPEGRGQVAFQNVVGQLIFFTQLSTVMGLKERQCVFGIGAHRSRICTAVPQGNRRILNAVCGRIL
ncbi:hypothetical protein IMSAGC015_02347 [Lachnospiraceae bacterium]|nr:hypothetical protein IMSAGC015_02347 [Lachnospiraceae bacterium]